MLFQRNYIDSNIKYLQQTQILKSLYVCNLMVVWHWVSNIWGKGNKSLWQRLNTFQEKLLCCLKEIISNMTKDLSKTKFEEKISLRAGARTSYLVSSLHLLHKCVCVWLVQRNVLVKILCFCRRNESFLMIINILKEYNSIIHLLLCMHNYLNANFYCLCFVE